MPLSLPRMSARYDGVSGGLRAEMDLLSLLLRALLIFTLRMLDITLYTIRVMMVVRGKKKAAWGIAFLQSLAYLNTIHVIVMDMHSWLNMIAYATGFATGLVVGMLLEKRISIGVTHLRIISSCYGLDLIAHLRAAGYAVTEIPAKGRDGSVTMLHCMVRQQDLLDVTNLVESIDPSAFITEQSLRLIWRGFWHGTPKHRLAGAVQKG